MRPTPLPTALIIAFALIASACSGSGEAESTTTIVTTAAETTTTTTPPTTTTSTTTSSTTTTTTTTLPPGPVAPLNGLELEDENLLDRRVVALKIDNHPNARPQSGVEIADAMAEILVEGGLTRFIALFHTTDTDFAGPIRSGRPTDPTILRPLNAVFVYSGAQAWVTNLILARGVKLIGEVAGTFRTRHRYAPHNLYGDTVALRGVADGRGYSDEFGIPLYEIADWDQLPAESAERITLNWASGNVVNWRYNNGRYLRFNGTTAHNWVDQDGQGAQIAADVLVVIAGDFYWAYPPAGIPQRKKLPAIDTVGSGDAYIFHEGRVIQGTWERDSIEEAFELFDENGEPMTVPAGRPWISIFPDNRSISWE